MAERDTLVLFPTSFRGHIIPMLEFGKLIHNHHPEFSITVIISGPPHNTPDDNLPGAYPFIHFHRLLPPEPSTTAAAAGPSSFATIRHNNHNLREALSTISQSTKVRAFFIDFFCTPAMEVSMGLNIPTYYYFTSGGVGLALFLYFPTLCRTFRESFKDLGKQILHIPGLPQVRASDMPARMSDRTSTAFQEIMEIATSMIKSSGIVINTCESLDSKVLTAISDGLCVPDGIPPPVYPIGPLIEIKEEGHHQHQERHECLQWLDSQPGRSVVFLCFGSMGRFSSAQLKEMATGLERSHMRFLWVVRPPPPEDKSPPTPSFEDGLTLDEILPDGFLGRTRDRGLVVKSWAPQVDVLHHRSVGGFVSHCGWNSIIEAVTAGVPMVTWPLYAEQKLNREFLVEEAKVAIAVTMSDDGFVTADELQSRLVELMDSQEGEVLRKLVMAKRDGVITDTSNDGSSRMYLAKLAEVFKQN